MTELIRKRELNVLLCEFLDTEAVLARPRHTDYSREVLDAVFLSSTPKPCFFRFFCAMP